MDNATRNIERLFNLLDKNIATINATLDYDRVTDAIILLCNTLENTETDESVWSIGECGAFSLDSLIVGAFWHYTEWHAGQWSKGYAALSALGSIYSPGMTSEPEPDSSEHDAYTLLADMAA